MFRVLIIITLLFGALISAPLFIESEAQQLLSRLNQEKATAVKSASSQQLVNTDQLSDASIGYKVVKRQRNESELARLQSVVGNANSTQQFFGYDEREGRYYFHTPHQTALPDTSPRYLKYLQNRSRNYLKRLVGADADNFVFANTETRWGITPSSGEKSMIGITFRYTLKINGRHIVDNTAYIRITYTGEEKLAAFEIVNPTLEPVSIPMMVKRSATVKRLQKRAEEKNTVRSSLGEEIVVEKITATKAIQSYLARKKGETVLLAPYISFYCRYNLRSGDSFERFDHFSLDATRCPNLDESMLERGRRR